MEVYYPEPTSVTIDRYGVYETELTAMFLDQLRTGMTVFDIGTHFGYYSLLALLLVGDSGAVHCFEPTPSTAAVLSRNLNGALNAHINNVALHSVCETLSFLDFGVGYSSFNTLSSPRISVHHQDQLRPQTRQVRALTIDAYVEQTNSRPDFMKIDAENAERDILSGGRETIAQFRPLFTLEVGDDKGDIGRSAELLSYAASFGYVPMQFDPKLRVCIEHKILRGCLYSHANVLMVPSEKVRLAKQGQLTRC